MAGKLSFAIAINLLTENFKRGTNQVKAGFRAMQMQVLTFAAALGAGGLGLSDLVTRFIDVARETNRVSTALKNVSGSMGQYADNQRYLLSIAQKYGLEINALTGNFAKFTAAAAISGMSMTEQRKVFESVSRACTAFGMSADDSNGVFLALSQMMSKGKISSEELRLQMGERLPVALQAMAKAAGVSVAGLDKLLKQGKLMSADVLPKFADALNEMIPNVDTDNLETSVNRLKNVFTELVNGTDAQSKYKTLIDWLTGAIQGAADNIKNIVIGVVAVISGLVANAVAKTVKGWGTAASQLAAFSETADNRMLSSTARRVAAEQALEKAKLQQALAVGSQKIVASEMVAKAETKLAAATAAEVKAKEVAKAAAAQAAAVTSSTAWGKACSVVKIGAAKVVASFTAMWSAFAPMIIVSAIVAIIGKFKSMYDEANRIKGLFDEYKKGAQSIGSTAEISALNAQLKIMNDKKQSQENINNAQSQLQKMLNVEHKSQEELNKLVAKRVSLLESSAKVDYYTRKKLEAQDKYNDLNGKHSKLKAQTMYGGFFSRLWNGSDVGDMKKEMNELLRIISDSSKEIENATVETNKLSNTTITPDDKKEKKTPLQKEQESFDKQFAELGAELEIGKLTQSEYNKALAELNIKMYAQGKGTGDKDVLESDYLKARKAAAEQAVKNMPDLNAKVELEKAEKEYTDARATAKAKLEQGLIAEDGYREAIVDAAMKAAESAASIEGVGSAADEFIKKMRNVAINNTLVPVLKKRDTTFDYKATGVDKAADNLDLMRQYRDDLEKAKQDGKVLSKELQSDLDNAIKSIPDLERALKLAEIKEDVKNFTKELGGLKWDATKGMVGDIDSLVSSFKNLADAFDPDSEADGWERLMALWDLFAGVVDSIMAVCNTLEAITELTNKLTQAKETETAIDTATTGAKIANKAAETTAEVTAATTTAAAVAAAGTVKATAASTVMAAESTAAYAGIPFVGIGLAAAQIAAMEAMIMAASIPKFANGGIITGGPSSGDKILARVNAGEMILNQGQQSNLFNAIDSGRLGGGSHVRVSGDVKLKGSDLYLSLDNYKKKTGKK